MHLAIYHSPIIPAIPLESAADPTFNAEPLRSATLVHASVYYIIGEFAEWTQSTADVAGEDFVLNSEGGELEFKEKGKSGRFERDPGQGT